MTKRILDIYDPKDRPEEGMVLVEDDRNYRVVSIRPVDSRLWHDRWALEVRRMAPGEEVPVGTRAMPIASYPRGFCPACTAVERGVEVPEFVRHRCERT